MTIGVDVSSLGPDAVRFQRPRTRNKPAKKLISNMLRTSTGIPPSTTRTMHMWEAPRRFCSLGLRCVDCSPGRNFADAMILSLRQTREMHCLLVRCSSLVGASSPSMPFRSCSFNVACDPVQAMPELVSHIFQSHMYTMFRKGWVDCPDIRLVPYI